VRYAALIYRDTDPDTFEYYAVVPALPDVFTWGDTYDEVIAHLKEAITLRLEDCDQIPVDVQGEPPHLALIDVDIPVPASVGS
jgi:predicted RNase H-like HicB family nuclease